MGNVSAASIPIAVHDAVRDGVIDRPMRVFTPGFGAGAVGGYAVLRIDPSIVAAEITPTVPDRARRDAGPTTLVGGASTADVEIAFGA
jgi:hypothetical protein